MRLLGADAFWGASEVRPETPAIERHRNALYWPRLAGPAWGLYDANGRILEASVDRWADGRPMAQTLDDAPREPDAPVQGGRYLYVGRDMLHYGHFLVETLCRCWPLLSAPEPGRKLLVHGGDFQKAWGGWAGHAVAGAIFERLGFGPRDLVHFDAPVRLDDVEIGWPAVRQQAYAHPIFRALCLHIGDPRRDPPGPDAAPARLGLRERVRRALGRAEIRPPIWLSRSAVYSGTMQVVNEVELETRLRERGFVIVHPEHQPFARQLDVFRDNDVITGFAGSAFHTHIFTRRQPRRIILSVEDRVNSGFAMFDKLTGSPAEYYRVEAALLEDLGPEHRGTDAQRFTRTYRVRDPAALADALERRVRIAATHGRA